MCNEDYSKGKFPEENRIWEGTCMRISKLRSMSKALFWGEHPLPERAEAKGVIETDNGKTGLLLLLSDGLYAAGSAGKLIRLNQDKVRRKLREA